MRRLLGTATAGILMALGCAATADAETWKFGDPPPPSLQSRIVNGSDAGGPIPWQVGLARVKNGGVDVPVQIYCGGTLRDSTHVVTAAHCLPDDPGDDPEEIAVIAGLYNLTTPDQNTAQIKPVVKISTHPGYGSSASSGNDAAVLTLGSPVTSTAAEPRPVTAANSGGFVGDSALISGWGTTSSGGQGPDRLLYSVIDVYPDSKCAPYAEGFITAVMLCAGYIDQQGTVYDTCQGDSGGPLMRFAGDLNNNNQYDLNEFDKLIGIVSFGRGCADAQYPGVYTRVTEPGINAFVTQTDPTARVKRAGEPVIAGAAGTITCTAAGWGNAPTGVEPKILLFTGTVEQTPQGNSLNVTATQEVAGRSYTATAADAAKFAQCEEKAINAGGSLTQTSKILKVSDAGTAPPPVVTPPPPAAGTDLSAPTSRVTRRSCSKKTKVCSLTIMIGDTGGSDLSKARLRVSVTQVSGCPRSGRSKKSKARAKACRKVRIVTAKRSSTGLYTVRTPKMRKGRVKIAIRATDAAGNAQLKATSVTLRVS